jgi:hypothetical protein
VPAIHNMLALSSTPTRPTKLKELSTFIGVMGVHMAPYYPAIFLQLLEFWLPLATVIGDVPYKELLPHSSLYLYFTCYPGRPSNASNHSFGFYDHYSKGSGTFCRCFGATGIRVRVSKESISKRRCFVFVVFLAAHSAATYALHTCS